NGLRVVEKNLSPIPPLLGDRQRAACFYSEFAEVTA
ncbi:hypothetical protein ACQSEY_19345, partial [Klebsiella pneumoniae]